jgi:uncharacterized protein YecE (DUF72 family)
MALDPHDRDHFPRDRREEAEALARRAPIPARVRNIRCGTASWTDPTLLKSGLFYPPGAKTAEQRLRHYASRFPLVEVDASYYALPTRAQAEAWVKRTPDDFVFDVKAYASITGHSLDLGRLPRDVQAELPDGLRRRRRARPDELPAALIDALRARFVDALQPLVAAGKLGAVLLQFPPWFDATRGNARRLAACREQLGDLPLCVEFRHRSWVDAGRRPRVFDLLTAQQMAWVAVDAPQVAADSALPKVPVVTWDKLAVVRFHGRNASTWEGQGTAAERFDWLYRPDELREWVDTVEELSEEAEEVHVLLNNCTYDAGVLGAYGMAALLDERLGA